MPTSDDAEPFLRALRADDPQRLYDLAPCGYVSTTPDGTVVKANQTFLTLCGYRAEQLVGRMRFDELLTPGGRIYHETHYAPMLRMHGAAREIALDLVRADGTRAPVLVNAVLDRDAAGEEVLVRIAVFDAADRRAYERELLGAKRRAEESDALASALAATLQQTLIPPIPPVIPALDLASEFLPAGAGVDIGGDFYDVFQLAAQDWALVIGDICGKGAEAAVITALARFTIRAEAMQYAQPASVLQVLNQVLLSYDTTRFCTLAMLRLIRSADGWSGQLCCAGHPLPMLRRVDGTVERLGEPGTLLGVVKQPTLHDTPVTLAAGESLVLFTDGVVEARHGADFYGERRATAVVGRGHASAAELAADLLADVLAFQQGPGRDDIAILAVRVPADASA